MDKFVNLPEMWKPFLFDVEHMAVSELPATATAGSPRRHALKYRTPLATPLAAAVATNSDTA